jgi:hypothetical protein
MPIRSLAIPLALAFTLAVPAGAVSPPGDSVDCQIRDALSREVTFQASEKLASRLLVGTLALANRYAEVRTAPAMQDRTVPTDARGELVKKLLEIHDSYVGSSGVHESPRMGYSSALVPPGLLTLIGVSQLLEARQWVAQGQGPGSLRITGWSSIVSAALSTTWILGTKSIGGEVLLHTAQGLTVEDRANIRRELETSLAEPSGYLGGILGWSEPQKAKFSSALYRRVLDTLILTAKTETQFTKKDHRVRYASRVVANLSDIDFVDLIRQQGLATESQLQALAEIQALQDLAAKLQSAEITATEAKKRLTRKDHGLRENISSLLRLHRLLQSTQAEIPEKSQSARDEVGRLLAQTTQAIETLRKLCKLGEI